MTATSLYIHYPYCLSKCAYCSFVSFPCKNENPDELSQFYTKELGIYKNIIGDRKISSIYFGGGTPSLMDIKLVEQVLNRANKLFKIDNDIEITLEANPKTIDNKKLKNLKSAGINRLSIGVQSLDDEVLKFLGRAHNSSDAIKILNEAKNIFTNITADFIYAYPNQTFDNWKQELKIIKGLNLPHLSLYELIIEPDTKIYRLVGEGAIIPIDEDTATDMFNYTNSFLKTTTPQYEVSNYAKLGFESKHNINYWEGGDYIGIGTAAAGRLKLNDKFYYSENPPTIEKWKDNILKQENPLKEMPLQHRAEEMIIMGLRQIKGINFTTFKNNLGNDFFDFIDKKKVDTLISQNLLIQDSDNIKTSPEGLLLLDSIIRDIIK